MSYIKLLSNLWLIGFNLIFPTTSLMLNQLSLLTGISLLISSYIKKLFILFKSKAGKLMPSFLKLIWPKLLID
jgi:hypothetical protein